MPNDKHWTYVLVMARTENGVIKDFDVFGLYSTKYEAELAKKWRKRDEGYWEGCQPCLKYNRCEIIKRAIDYNVPPCRKNGEYYPDREALEEAYSEEVKFGE